MKNIPIAELTQADVLKKGSSLPQIWIDEYTFTPRYTLLNVSLVSHLPSSFIRFTRRAEGKEAITIVKILN